MLLDAETKESVKGSNKKVDKCNHYISNYLNYMYLYHGEL